VRPACKRFRVVVADADWLPLDKDQTSTHGFGEERPQLVKWRRIPMIRRGGSPAISHLGRTPVDQIIPRWEWRTFGQEFGAALAHLAAMAPDKVQTSDEIYLLASGSDANVKIRDQLLDIKVLECVDANGLEQWRPALKEPFPLSASTVAAVRTAVGLTPGPSDTECLSLDQLVAALAPSVRKIAVHKTRARYQIHGCVGELTDVIADGEKVRTIAVEDADPAKVIAAVRALGLEGRPNTSYPRGLAQLLGLPARGRTPLTRQAVIDVGTNSVKFIIAELEPDETWTTILDRAEVTRLGEGLEESGAMSPAAIERTAQAITGMTVEAARHGVEGITAVGTMGMRTATNSQALIDLVKDRAGVTVEVISGAEECRVAYLAVKSGLGLADAALAIFDTGGGSTQITLGRGTRVDRQFSVNVGAARYTAKFHLDQAVSADQLQQAIAAIAADLSELDGVASPDALVGMGGAVTNITAVMLGLSKYDPDKVQGSVIDRNEIDRQIERYRAMHAESRRQIVGLQPKRAEVILAGACIVRTIMDKLGKSSLSVSDRGLRHGLLVDRFGGGLARRDGAR
jgi:exopolyphosphatase/guanosine-5'-triphosphate,3'-diphosphate pyrophosphatase